MNEAYFNLNDVILILSIGLSLVLALSQPLFTTKNSRSKYLLASFFLCIAVFDVAILLIWNEIIPKGQMIQKCTPYFYATAALLKGPALMLYVCSITNNDFSFKPLYWLHLIPAILVGILFAMFSIDITLIRLDTFGMDSPTYLVVDYSLWFMKLAPFLYFTYAFFVVWKYHSIVFTQNSSVNIEPIIWLYLLTGAYIASALWSLILGVLAVMYRLPYGVTDNYINFALLIAIFFYSVALSPKLTSAKSERTKSSEPEPNEKITSLVSKIMHGIKEEKLYLQANINVEQFSEKVGLPYRDVSFAINRAFGNNFFEFINSYRIEEAKRYLSDEQYLDMSIMEILMESGFNSKSSFQRFFKRLTGESPSEYRKRMLG
ncbi:HTH-type transcriptional activator Btr [Thalassocella blandensis]|nr:HTH-type transcriptional activator Btr [Thalassocella blandensis]